MRRVPAEGRRSCGALAALISTERNFPTTERSRLIIKHASTVAGTRRLAIIKDKTTDASSLIFDGPPRCQFDARSARYDYRLSCLTGSSSRDVFVRRSHRIIRIVKPYFRRLTTARYAFFNPSSHPVVCRLFLPIFGLLAVIRSSYNLA